MILLYLRIFSNVKSYADVVKVLKKIQDEEDHYCQTRQKQSTTASSTTTINWCSIYEIYEHFKTGFRNKKKKYSFFSIISRTILVNYSDFDQKDGKEILAYLRKPILKIPSYGALFYNSKQEVNIIIQTIDVFIFFLKYNLYVGISCTKLS